MQLTPPLVHAAAVERDTVQFPAVLKATDIVSEVHARNSAIQRAKLVLYQEWYLNLAFYLGRQWCYFDRAAMSVADIPMRDAQEIRVTRNRIQPMVRAILAQLQSARPQAEVVPFTSETLDELAGRVSQVLYDWAKQVLDAKRIMFEADLYRLVYGTTALRVWPDPKGGQQVTLRLRKGLTTVQEAELRGEVYSPFDFGVWPLNASTPRHVSEVHFTTYQPVEKMRDAFPRYAHLIQEAGDIAADEYQRRRLDVLLDQGAQSLGEKFMRGLCRCFEIQSLPTSQFPQGRKITVINDVLVEHGANPYVGLLPPESPRQLQLGTVFMRGIPRPGSFWGIGIPEVLRDGQISRNRLLSDLETNRAAVGKNKIFVQKNSGIDEDALAGIHGEVIEYNQGVNGTPAHVVAAIPLPSQVFDEIAVIDRDAEDSSARPDVTRGRNPTQVRAAAHAATLQEAANVELGVFSMEREDAECDMGRLIMGSMKRYYSPQKVRRIVGSQKAYAPFVLQQLDLYTDVAVVPGSALPRNRSAHNMNLAQLWQMGALVKPDGRPDVEYLRTNMDMGGTRWEAPEQVDIDHANSECIAMMQGQWQNVAPFDNHILEIETKIAFLKKNRQLPPPAQLLIWKHIELHRLYLVAASIMPPGLVHGGQPEANQPTPEGAAA